ncbi:MAG: hypothetical protein PHD37_00425 [Gallionellaceae bacterium]|nr:hypothetical protein [Gallionellaceae bacterium]
MSIVKPLLPALLAGLAAGGALANHDVGVNNTMKEAIRVYWTAAGCAGVSDGRTFVCMAQDVSPGQSASYGYKAGTSLQKVSVGGPGACANRDPVKVGNGVVVNADCALTVIDAPPVANCASLAVKAEERVRPGAVFDITTSYPDPIACAHIPLFTYTAQGPNGIGKVIMVSPLPATIWQAPKEEGEYTIWVADEAQEKYGKRIVGSAKVNVTSSPCLDFDVEAVDGKGRALSATSGIEAGAPLTLRTRSARCEQPLKHYYFGVRKPDGQIQPLSPFTYAYSSIALSAPGTPGIYVLMAGARSENLKQADREISISVTTSNCSNITLSKTDGDTLKAETQGCKPGYYEFRERGNRGHNKLLCKGALTTCAFNPASGQYWSVDAYQAEGQAVLGTATLR